MLKLIGRTIVGFVTETPKAAINLVKGLTQLVPGMIKGTGDAAEAIGRHAVSFAGGTKLLQQWIIQSMKDAERKGVHPIPKSMRIRLDPHFRKDLLDRVRYRVGSHPWTTLPEVGFDVFGVRAMVVGHIIVFRDEDAASEFWLWVHECVHVVQYSRGTITEFARRYITDHESLENEAAEFANKVSRTGQGRMERDKWNWSEGQYSPPIP